MDSRKPLGKHRVAEARDDQRALDLASSLTGLGVDVLRERLRAASGKALVRNALSDVWPSTASALGAKTAAVVRDAGMHAELQWITRGSKHLISRRLNAAAGNRLIKSLFWDVWPSADTAPPVPQPEPDPEGDGQELELDELEPVAHDTDPPPPGFQTGALISSRYDVKEEIGRGGFGTTWLAHDRLSGLDIVLKVPHADDGGAIRHELELAFQLVHPNICQAFPDRDDETGQPFLVMQHGGLDLRALLERRKWKPFPLSQALHVLASIADALDYLHDNLLLHLDVSPMNILVDDDGVVRLTDFGASSRARTTATSIGTNTVLAGEVTSFHQLWSAPELFRRVGRSRSDQFSLFLVFITLLTGRFPRHPGDLAKPPFPALTDSQNAAVRRALSTEPEDRFDTCGEAARAVIDGMGPVPATVIAADVDAFAGDLLARLKRELARASRAHTTRVGAVMKLGRGIERLLLATFLWVAAIEGFDPAREIRNRYSSIREPQKAAAGQLAALLRQWAGSNAARRPEVARIVADLESSSSRIWAFVSIRNEAAHEGSLNPRLWPAVEALSALLEEHLAARAGAQSS